MSWQTGTSAEYLNMLDQLSDIATSDHVITSVINAGGTGYTVNDVLSVAGGTKTHTATIIVTTVSGGVITAVRLFEGGAYTADPTLTANAVTGGTGTGATVDLTMETATWTLKRETKEALSATIGAGGTGYTVGDDITVTGGLGVGVSAVFNVDTVSGGVVTAVSLLTAGDYEETPTNPAATTGGTGTGCTLTVTYQRSAAGNGKPEKVLILEGEGGGGTDQILVAWKTFQATDQSTFDTVYNWGTMGITAFNSSLVTHQQAGITPGFVFSTGVVDTGGGAYMPLKNDDAFDMSFWISVTGDRIILICKAETGTTTFYPSEYYGFMNSFGTDAEFPYPIIIVGAAARENTRWDDTPVGRITGLSECIGLTTRNGPAWYLRSDSVWQDIQNSDADDDASPSRVASKKFNLYPCGQSTIIGATEDLIIIDTTFTWEEIIPNFGLPGTPIVQLALTPQSGGDLRLMVPITATASDGTFLDVLGELDTVFFFYADNGETSEDTFTDANGDVYRIFQCGNRTEEYSFFAVKEG